MRRVEESDWELLRKAATEARKHAYAPYSNYPVGAAVLTADHEIFTGCNVENASFGLTICAERNAVFAAVTGSHGRPDLLAAYIDAEPPASSCGACRQVLAEFGPDALVSFPGDSGRTVLSVSELLPGSFRFPD